MKDSSSRQNAATRVGSALLVFLAVGCTINSTEQSGSEPQRATVVRPPGPPAREEPPADPRSRPAKALGSVGGKVEPKKTERERTRQWPVPLAKPQVRKFFEAELKRRNARDEAFREKMLREEGLVMPPSTLHSIRYTQDWLKGWKPITVGQYQAGDTFFSQVFVEATSSNEEPLRVLGNTTYFKPERIARLANTLDELPEDPPWYATWDGALAAVREFQRRRRSEPDVYGIEQLQQEFSETFPYKATTTEPRCRVRWRLPAELFARHRSEEGLAYLMSRGRERLQGLSALVQIVNPTWRKDEGWLPWYVGECGLTQETVDTWPQRAHLVVEADLAIEFDIFDDNKTYPRVAFVLTHVAPFFQHVE